jgi:hypothetical protein
MDVWVERELAGCEFPDQRLEARLGKLLTALGRKIGATLPTACQDWAAKKAAYRFFANPRVDESRQSNSVPVRRTPHAPLVPCEAPADR